MSSPKFNVLASPNSSHSQTASAAASAATHDQIADIVITPPPASARRQSTSSAVSDTPSSVSVPLGQEWYEVPLGDLVQREHLITVDADTSVEQAFNIMDENDLTSLPVRDHTEPNTTKVSHTFDYADLNAYLLLVLGHLEPLDESADTLENVQRARQGRPVPVQFVSQLGIADPYVVVPATATLLTAAEILGNGVHRIAVSDPVNTEDVIGVISQRRLVRYIWENARSFKSLEPLLQRSLADLDIGSKHVMHIDADDPVIDALQLMHNEGVSSLAVVDSSQNMMLIGNISIVDVRLLTKYSQSPLLKSSCKQFLHVILSKRGLQDGRDSFPVFYVTKETSLARTMAKMVATRSHRLWITQTASPQESPTTQLQTDGKVVGVVSLTDVLLALAKHSGKDKLDPTAARKQRRRSSSVSVRRVEAV